MENSSSSIEIQLKSPRQFFDARDPAPFRERDLGPSAAEYIIESVSTLSGQKPVNLHLYFESLESDFKESDVISSTRLYFHSEYRRFKNQLKALLREGFVSLVIGVCFLGVCFYLSTVIGAKAPGYLRFVSEGLIVIGWVAMWRPADTFLYAWWPILKKIKLYKRISEIPVVVHTK